jgi:hypothetical protein
MEDYYQIIEKYMLMDLVALFKVLDYLKATEPLLYKEYLETLKCKSNEWILGLLTLGPYKLFWFARAPYLLLLNLEKYTDTVNSRVFNDEKSFQIVWSIRTSIKYNLCSNELSDEVVWQKVEKIGAKNNKGRRGRR